MSDFIVVIRRTGLAPWEFEFLFPGSLTSIYLPVKQAKAELLPQMSRHLDLILCTSARFDHTGICTGVSCVCQDVTLRSCHGSPIKEYVQEGSWCVQKVSWCVQEG